LPGQFAVRGLRAAADGFAERYLAMLAAGGTKHHSSCWLRSGSTPAIPPSGRAGLASSSGMIAELEALD
jgi:oligoendopeptidase F